MTEIKRKKRKNPGRQWVAVILFTGILVGIFFAVSPSTASDTSSGLGPYFGTIPVFSEDQISELRMLLKKIGDNDCGKFGKECPRIDEFFNKFMGDIRNPNNPKLLIYIDENLEIRTNTVLWKNRVTAHLFDVQNIWVTIFSEKNTDIETVLTTLFKENTPGRFAKRIFMPAEVTEKERKTRNIAKPVSFRKLRRENIDNNLWLGIVRFYLEPQTASRISVFPGKSSDTLIKKKTVTVHESGEVTVVTEDRSEIQTARKEDRDKPTEPGFYLSEANFTNSGGSRLGLSAAIGAAFNIDDNRLNETSLGNTNFDLYLCAHLYLIRPTLTKAVKGRSYKPSYSLVAGTGGDILNEIILGVSVGHLFAKNGFIIGANIMDPFKEWHDERQIRPFFAFDIRF